MINICVPSGRSFTTQCSRWILFIFVCLLTIFARQAIAQTESATLSGTIVDQSGALVPDVRVHVTNDDTEISVERKTNGAGVYSVPALKPGRYRVAVSKEGFKQVVVRDLVLNVQDVVSRNFTLQVGGTSETVQVQDNATMINTTDATVSTVVDRRFVENMPLNGRSFQALIGLTPGVVTTPTSFAEEGQFSVNGQRADANYFMVDGVSANVGTSSGFGLIQSVGGGLPGLSTFGSTNTLVSVDAMQEFRIQTSTFAPEFGRTPGAQVSIVTRSGSNQFHGTLFDYFRNEALDARDWFVDHNHLPKPKERQNDFGGVFGGPIVKDRTFFFFSYEGLRLRQPSTMTSFVPDLAARQTAPQAIQPLLNAFPLPNGSEVGGNAAQFNASFSNPASLDAYSIRIDQTINSKFTAFGRYDYAPSELETRGLTGVQEVLGATQTITLGLTAAVSAALNNELRANYSNARAGTVNTNDSFGGAIPLTANTLPLPAGFNPTNSAFSVSFNGVNGLGSLRIGKNTTNEQRQFNLVDNTSLVTGNHQLKWGLDYRWLAPFSSPLNYQQGIIFSGLNGPTGALAGKALFLSLLSFAPSAFLSRNISLYGQDTWKLTPHLTMTYGLRWDINPAAKGKNSASTPIALQNVENPVALNAAPLGTSLYPVSYSNIAPRIGIAYQITSREQWSTTLHGGFGLFYDSGSGSLGFISTGAPFEGSKTLSGVPYPFTAAQLAPPPLSTGPPFTASVFSTDPALITPRTYQWNLSIEQEVGSQQVFSLTYVGAAGRDLLRQDTLASPNPIFASSVFITRNGATSDYHALQLKFQRQLSRGLQALASYTWSHSIDIASNDSATNNTPPSIGISLDRGNSDFDVRHSVSAAVSYDIPKPRIPGVGAIIGSWSVDDLLIARSALPVTVLGNAFQTVAGTTFAARPNVVPGVPFYLSGSQFPGGVAFNKTAFVSTVGATQGDLPRNDLRGFGAWQDDFTLRRQFHLTEKIGLQFRTEFFNIFNHPNFGSPVISLQSSSFGQSTQTLAKSLSPGALQGGLSSLYQIGGPRSIQLALKLMF